MYLRNLVFGQTYEGALAYREYTEVMDNPSQSQNALSAEALKAQIAALEAQLLALQRQLPAHSIPPGLIAQMDALDEQLAALRDALNERPS
jgi:Tfp pilus assembly protein PilO